MRGRNVENVSASEHPSSEAPLRNQRHFRLLSRLLRLLRLTWRLPEVSQTAKTPFCSQRGQNILNLQDILKAILHCQASGNAGCQARSPGFVPTFLFDG